MALTTDLQAFWELEEASGTRDDAHSTNDLADNNTVTSGTGKVGTAASFASANSEFLSIADNAPLSGGNVDFTICAWVKMASKTGYQAFVAKTGGSENAEYELGYDQPADRFAFQATGDANWANKSSAIDAVLGSPSTGTWYFLIGYHDAATDVVGVRINNGSATTAALTIGVSNTNASFRIGSWDGNFSFVDGLVDQVGFWRRLLTSDEQTWLYNSGSGRSYADIVAESTGYSPAAAALAFTGPVAQLRYQINMPDEA
jgi:concanavalin A-like lectin/glucanase superfamily protein